MNIYYVYKCDHGKTISFAHECRDCSKEKINKLEKQLICSHEWFLDGDCSDKEMARTYCNKCELIKWVQVEPPESPQDVTPSALTE
jgi:hypothetical protein